MKITKDNYEAYLLDLLEGRLSSEERSELMVFIESHPELEADFDILDATLREDHLPETEKNTLKADPDAPEALDWLMAKAIEGDAPELPEFKTGQHKKHWEAMKRTKLEAGEDQAPDLSVPREIEQHVHLAVAVAEGDINNAFSQKLMQDAVFSREVERYRKVQLLPDAVNYPYKSALKREAAVVPLYRRFAVRSAAIAAIGLALVAAWWLTPDMPRQAQIALNPGSSLNVEREVQQASDQDSITGQVDFAASRLLSGAADANTPPENALTPATSRKNEGTGGKPTLEKASPSLNRLVVNSLASLELRHPALLRREAESARTLELPANGLVAVNLPDLPQEAPEEQSAPKDWQAALLDLAKERVLGRQQQEGESFAEALAMRVEEKTDGQVTVAPNGRDNNRFYLRLGSFSIER